jgi:MFS family permease
MFGRLMDTYGRRTLFLTAYAVMGMSAYLLNSGVILGIPAVALFSFFAAVTGFAMGMGNVPYVLITEVVDAPAVSRCDRFCTFQCANLILKLES